MTIQIQSNHVYAAIACISAIALAITYRKALWLTFVEIAAVILYTIKHLIAVPKRRWKQYLVWFTATVGIFALLKIVHNFSYGTLETRMVRDLVTILGVAATVLWFGAITLYPFPRNR